MFHIEVCFTGEDDDGIIFTASNYCIVLWWGKCPNRSLILKHFQLLVLLLMQIGIRAEAKNSSRILTNDSKESTPHAYPFMVYFHHPQGTSQASCGGTILGNNNQLICGRYTMKHWETLLFGRWELGAYCSALCGRKRGQIEFVSV